MVKPRLRVTGLDLPKDLLKDLLKEIQMLMDFGKVILTEICLAILKVIQKRKETEMVIQKVKLMEIPMETQKDLQKAIH